MTRAREVAGAMAAVVARDASVFFSFRFRMVSQTVVALFSLTLFHYVSRLVGVDRFPTPDDYFAFVVVGLVILQSLTATLAAVPNAVRGELVAGTFERVAVSPLGPAAAIAAMTIFPALLAAVTGALTVLIAVVVFGMPIAGPEALLALPAAALGLLAFVPFALLVAALVLVSKQAGAVVGLIVVGLSLAGGVYFPPDLLPGWVEWVTEVQPFTPALELLRHLLIDADVDSSAGESVLRLVLFAAVANPLAYAVLQRAIAGCRRRGTLIES